MKFELRKRGFETPFIATYYKTDIEITAENIFTLKDELISQLRKPLGILTPSPGGVQILADMSDNTYVILFLESPEKPFISRTPLEISDNEE